MLLERLGKELLYFDGGMGTLLQSKGLQPGELPEVWNLEHAKEIIDIHKAYFEAGSDIVLSNTFGANAIKFHDSKYGLKEIVTAGIQNAKKAAERGVHDGRKTYVALDVGPTGKLLKPMGDLSFEDAYDAFKETMIYGEQAGADLINDIWGLKYDARMAEVIAKYHAACCLMHNREKAEYEEFQKDFIEDMKECVRLAKEAGIADEKIILDPGVGFGKTYEMNLEIIAHLEILQELGYPVLLGTSRKSVIGLTLDLPVDQREEGTMVTTVYGVQKGSAFVRVHDVEKNLRAIKMTKALMRM